MEIDDVREQVCPGCAFANMQKIANEVENKLAGICEDMCKEATTHDMPCPWCRARPATCACAACAAPMCGYRSCTWIARNGRWLCPSCVATEATEAAHKQQRKDEEHDPAASPSQATAAAPEQDVPMTPEKPRSKRMAETSPNTLEVETTDAPTINAVTFPHVTASGCGGAWCEDTGAWIEADLVAAGINREMDLLMDLDTAEEKLRGDVPQGTKVWSSMGVPQATQECLPLEARRQTVQPR